MTYPKAIRSNVLTTTVIAFVISLAVPCVAESSEDEEFTGLQTKAKESLEHEITPFLKNYCFRCHSNKRQKGGINFQPFLKKPGTAAAHKRWKQAIANVSTHDMPPEDEDQPTDEERGKFIDSISLIKYLSPKDPGPFVIRRLTKTEYANTLHDLFGVDVEVANDLPDEVFGAGYLNTLSPLQSEQYLGIANVVLDRILAPADAPPTEIQKRLFGEPPAPDADQRTMAKTVARSLAGQAYRRPPSEAETEVLLGVFDLGRDNGLGYQSSLRLMLKAILVSPQFLFITPADGKDASEDIVPLDDYQLASRLSYLLWATMPDAELLAMADQGKLHARHLQGASETSARG